MDAKKMLDEMRALMESVPAPLVLMKAPVPRGTLYAEERAGAVVPLKFRARVVLVHEDDVAMVQASATEAGLPQFRVVTADDMAPPRIPPLGTF